MQHKTLLYLYYETQPLVKQLISILLIYLFKSGKARLNL